MANLAEFLRKRWARLTAAYVVNGAVPSDLPNAVSISSLTPTPAAHASTHAAAGSDPVTGIVNSQIDAAAAIAESKLALNFATHSNANDPSAGEKAALAGTSGTPGSGNKYVTDADPRNTNDRDPNPHAADHLYTAADALTPPLVFGSSGALAADLTNSTGANVRAVFVSEADSTQLACVANTNSNEGGNLGLFKTRVATGTTGDTIVANNDVLYSINFYGADGVDFAKAATIRAEVDGTPGSNDMPGRMILMTTPDGAAAPVEVLRLAANALISASGGSFLVGGTSLDSDLTDIAGTLPGYVVLRSPALHQHFVAVGFAANASGPTFAGYKNRALGATQNANTIVSSGDGVLKLVGYGADGATYRPAAQITFEVDGTPGSSDMPGRIVMATTLDGAATPTERVRIDNAGVMRHMGLNGQSTDVKLATTTVTCSGASSDATNLIPAGSLVLGVTCRVTTAITGATSFDVGDTTSANIYGDNIAVAAGTTTNLANLTTNRTSPLIYNAATSIRLTANGSNFTGGVVRVTVHYISLTAPTS